MPKIIKKKTNGNGLQFEELEKLVCSSEMEVVLVNYYVNMDQKKDTAMFTELVKETKLTF